MAQIPKCDFCGHGNRHLYISSLGDYICSICLEEGRDPDTYKGGKKRSPGQKWKIQGGGGTHNIMACEVECDLLS